MEKLINIKEYPVSNVLKQLLADKTTGRNIVFATNAYMDRIPPITERAQITVDILSGFSEYVLQPRVAKSLEMQSERTRKRAEVFTPSWICNKMNNHCDTEWFRREGVFNIEKDKDWEPTKDKVAFEKDKDWQKYVDSKRLEITCGEAPYVISRYDTTTAEMIPIERRIGILDRKLRVVNENTETEEEWLKWVYRAFQSCYAYEFQGDNLLIARINVLDTFVEYLKYRWGREATDNELKKVANIIVWNFWQMDGIKGTVPFGEVKEEYPQMSFFDYTQGGAVIEKETVECKIKDWRSNESVLYNSLREG